ncbi:MAG: acyltransferase [Hyphomonadaceae bacterium]|nr:acyltransferase [Hyphomonadaceae bacterium]
MARSGESAGGRVIGLDVARGALMAYVVIAIHGMFWLNLVSWDVASVFLFEMPLIFMIAGAAFYLSEQGAPVNNYFDFLARRGVRILVPYFAYAIVEALIMIALRYHEVDTALAALGAWLNPINGGAGYSERMMNWHLWFVAPFLAVTALMPFLGPLAARAHAPLWSQALGAAALVLAVDLLDTTRLGMVQTIVFYALWAAFGFALAANYARTKLADFLLMGGIAAAALAAAFALMPDQLTFQMQSNKFPPNALFFLFCCVWVSVFLVLARLLSPQLLQQAATHPLLAPFIRSGYSIYLWQGLGYWSAVQAGRALDWSNLAIWPLAIAFSVALGLVASPLERIRLPKPARTAQPA